MHETKLGDSGVASPSQGKPAFLDPWAEVHQHQNMLPHWQQDGRTYFLTFHLADSIPRSRWEAWRHERDAWLAWNPPPWSTEQTREYNQRFARTIERWLDASEGSCLLRHHHAAEIVGDALRHFDGNRCDQHVWVVMPNHAHLLVSLRAGEALPDLLRSWKGYTSRAINHLFGLHGTLWQKDYYDRLIRNAERFWNCARYIQRNPEKAHLQPGEYLLYESACVRQQLGEATSKSPSLP